MLVAAVRERDLRELLGQLVRISVAGLGSAVGRYPVGNTGRARVPIAAPMPIEDDLAQLLIAAGETVGQVTSLDSPSKLG